MKPGVILVNTARGALVDEDEMARRAERPRRQQEAEWRAQHGDMFAMTEST